MEVIHREEGAVGGWDTGRNGEAGGSVKGRIWQWLGAEGISRANDVRHTTVSPKRTPAHGTASRSGWLERNETKPVVSQDSFTQQHPRGDTRCDKTAVSQKSHTHQHPRGDKRCLGSGVALETGE